MGTSKSIIKNNCNNDDQIPQRKQKHNITSKNEIERIPYKEDDCLKLNNSPDPQIMLDLNNFILEKVIGRGSFGKVLLVRLKSDQQLFALKMIKKIDVINLKLLNNLKAEKFILSKLSNQFIIKFKFSFQNKEKLFLAYEYCNGGDMFFHLRKMQRFSENIGKFYAVEIYHALNYLHENNILYRDLKPENIILDGEGHIKLIDFGFAKSNISEENLTSSFCGTSEYIPPEVVRGEKYSFNFDWWTYGNIIYEMIYGFPAFSDTNKTNLFNKIIEEHPSFDNSVSDQAIDLIKLLLHKDIDRRIKPEQIPYHPWFKNINFEDIKNLQVKSPLIPKITNEKDFSNVDPSFLEKEILSPPKSLILSDECNKILKVR